MNNVDLAVLKIRELQSMIYDNSTSQNDLFDKTREVLEFMEKASIEINSNYEEISDKLTKQFNTGRKQ